MKRSAPLFGFALALLCSAATNARAELISWSYSWSRDPVSVAADGNGTGGVSFTNESTTRQATGSSDIVATNLKVFSTATATEPDVLTQSGAYSLALTITDNVSGAEGTVTFTGKLGGTFSADNSNITNAFDSPLTQFLSLGANNYTISIGPFSPPGPQSQTNSGSIAAHVDVSTLDVQKAPEPSAILLSCLGVSFLGGVSWRKRRRAEATPV